jgi:hypothetical protein
MHRLNHTLYSKTINSVKLNYSKIASRNGITYSSTNEMQSDNENVKWQAVNTMERISQKHLAFHKGKY